MLICPHTHVHSPPQKPGSLSLRSGMFTKKNLKLTELNKWFICLQSVALQVISLAQESAFTPPGQQVTGSSPGWGTWNFSIFRYLGIVLAGFTTEGVCLFPQLGAFWRFVTHVKEDLAMWKALSPQDFHHEMGWIIGQICGFLLPCLYFHCIWRSSQHP